MTGVPSAAAAPNLRFLLRHPANLVALGFGSGLAPRAPGTIGTLWAWASYLVLDRWLDPAQWAVVLVLGLAVGWWACTRAAQHLGIADPGVIVWDEVLAFWLILWVLMPVGFWPQLAAFALFRYFDAAKPGPVRWADSLFKPSRTSAAEGARWQIGWAQGFGILLDDLVAALCTLLLIAVAVQLWRAFF